MRLFLDARSVFFPLAPGLLLMAGACDQPESAAPPSLPAQLVAHEELPYGDRVSVRITRARNAALDLLEPRFGALETRILTLPAAERQAMLGDLQARMPQGWSLQPQGEYRADYGQLIAYAREGELFALLLVNAPDAGDTIPVVLLQNDI